MAATMVRGFCPLDCPDTCSWQIEVDDTGRAVSLRADRDHPFTAGALCGKVNHYLDAVYSPDRLLHPLRRVGRKGEGRFEQITWEEALRLTAEGLQDAIERHGPESILPYYYAGTMGYIQGWTLGPRLFRHLGASQLHTNLCSAAAHAACDATLGAAVGYDPEDVVDAKLVILWGTNPLNANLHMWKFVLEARARGAHLVAVDPIRSESAARCDEHIAPLPGTDAALALGLMRTVLDEGAADIDWLERHTVGWPELEARLAEWPVERAAEVCGLDVGVVRALGRRLAHTRPTAIRLGLGMQRHGGAGAAIRAVLAIPAVTGDWRHVGGGALSLTSDHFPFPVASVVSPPDLPAPPARTVNMSRLGEALTETADPPIAAMVVFNANPAASNPNQVRVRRGLARDDLFTVVLEQRLTDTTDFADVVLPVTMQPEHHDIYGSYGHLYVQWNEPAIEPPGECRPNTDVFRAIAKSMGLGHPRLYDSDLELGAQLLDDDAWRARGVTLAALRERGWMRGAGFERGTAPFAHGGFPTRIREGRARLGGARPRRPGPARRLRASPRGARPRAGRAVPARPHGAGRKVLPQLDVRLDRLAPEQDGPGHRAPPPGGRRGARPLRRRRNPHPQRPRLLRRPGARERCAPAGRRLHAQVALAEARRRRRQRERDHAGAGRGHGRRADLPRQPRRGRAALRGSAQGRGHLGHGLAGRMRSGPYRL